MSRSTRGCSKRFKCTNKEANASVNWNELPTIVGGKNEIRLLFQNLISNALKFRKENVAPQISINSSKDENYWLFTVNDNGIGINLDDQDEIFSIFKQVHPKSTYEGNGIGLTHCLKIVELHNGKIWVDSHLEKGSSFHFSIKKP